MTRKQIIDQLHSLASSQRSFIDKEDPECVFLRDCEALEAAARIIEDLGETPIGRARNALRRWRNRRSWKVRQK